LSYIEWGVLKDVCYVILILLSGTIFYAVICVAKCFGARMTN